MPNNPNDPVLSPGCSVPTPKVPQQQLVLQNGMKTVVGGLRGMVRSMIGCDATSGVKSVRPASPDPIPTTITFCAKRSTNTPEGRWDRDINVLDTTATFRTGVKPKSNRKCNLIAKHCIGALKSDVVWVDGNEDDERMTVDGMTVVGELRVKFRLGKPCVQFPMNTTFDCPFLVVEGKVPSPEMPSPVRLSQDMLRQFRASAAWQQPQSSDSPGSYIPANPKRPAAADPKAKVKQQEEAAARKQAEQRQQAAEKRENDKREKQGTQGSQKLTTGGKKDKDGKRKGGKDDKKDGKKDKKGKKKAGEEGGSDKEN
ncbi:hypothetical protein SLS57_010432 [Botryosphaeria dothidea]